MATETPQTPQIEPAHTPSMQVPPVAASESSAPSSLTQLGIAISTVLLVTSGVARMTLVPPPPSMRVQALRAVSARPMQQQPARPQLAAAPTPAAAAPTMLPQQPAIAAPVAAPPAAPVPAAAAQPAAVLAPTAAPVAAAAPAKAARAEAKRKSHPEKRRRVTTAPRKRANASAAPAAGSPRRPAS